MKNLRDGLQQQHNLLVEKLARFRQAHAIETMPDVKFKLETQIAQVEKELRQINLRLNFFTRYFTLPVAAGGIALLLVLLGGYLYYTVPKTSPIQQVNQDQATGNIYTGTVYITNTKGISDETFQQLSEELGVTKAAIKSFFNILEQQQVPPENLDATLREIAARYKELLTKVNALQANDPEIQKLKDQAKLVLENGEFERAEQLLNNASAKDVEAAKQLQETAERRLLSAAEAKFSIGQLKRTQLAYTEAVDYYQQAITLLPKGHDEILALYLNQDGLTLYSVAQYARAESLYQRALAISELALGKTHPNVATCLNNLAELYRTQGKYDKAEPLYQRALAISEQMLGKMHPDVARNLNNLALLYAAQGKYAEAESLYQRALAILEQSMGKTHPNMATCLNNLAELYRAQGKYAEAEPLYQQSLVILEQISGKVHPNVASSLNNLALLFSDQGKYAKAEPLYQRSLSISEQILGKMHPDVANSLNNLAGLYYAQGKYVEAKPLLERALKIVQEYFPPEHPTMRLYSKNYTELLYKLGNATPTPATPKLSTP